MTLMFRLLPEKMFALHESSRTFKRKYAGLIELSADVWEDAILAGRLR